MARLQGITKNLNAFLDLIAFSEGTIGRSDDGYNIIVGGSNFQVTALGYSDHPRKLITLNSSGLKSTAAGRYQILSKYYDSYKKSLKLSSFSPENQDKIAIQMIKEQHAINDVHNGDIIHAINKCNNIWASFPGNDYGQKQHDIGLLIKKFIEYGGSIHE
jgi:muramidase (phage lysozyme)